MFAAKETKRVSSATALDECALIAEQPARQVPKILE